jgi:dTDP-4-amino-4,6-dideoxygalactose transaminase
MQAFSPEAPDGADRPVFKGGFTKQEPIPEAGILAATALLRSGRLHRYNLAPGERSETAALEAEFAASVGARYCLACASGGYAMQLALRAWGARADEPVLTNAFTLSPVPGAIAAVGARPVLVETTADLTIDLDDLAERARASGARLLLLSHMRGHIADMRALTALLDRLGVALIEDCAHTMGAGWGGKPTGTFGAAGCFSTQTYKHINSGEGGLLVSDDPGLMARAIVLSGSYMLYDRHEAAPPPEAFADIRLDAPNMSGRMDDLRAAILRPQLAALPENARRWNARYAAVAEALNGAEGLRLPERPAEEGYVASSIQFLCAGLDAAAAERFVARCKARGVELKWFGAAEPAAYTSRHAHWRYVARRSLPRTDAALAGLFDMRLPLTFTLEDCRLIGAIIRESLAETRAGAA